LGAAAAYLVPNVLAQPAPGARDAEEAIHQARRLQQIQQIESDSAGYAAAIVGRWEESARKAGRWDRNYSADLLASLSKLDPENLLEAGEAPTYEAMMAVLATGKPEPMTQGLAPSALGQSFQDLVYTPVTPCRIVDTRTAVAGALAGCPPLRRGQQRPPRKQQPVRHPLGVAQAVTMAIVAVQPAGRAPDCLGLGASGQRPHIRATWALTPRSSPSPGAATTLPSAWPRLTSSGRPGYFGIETTARPDRALDVGGLIARSRRPLRPGPNGDGRWILQTRSPFPASS
jgi:hypothetical protein